VQSSSLTPRQSKQVGPLESLQNEDEEIDGRSAHQKKPSAALAEILAYRGQLSRQRQMPRETCTVFHNREWDLDEGH
jgi:hypothetical protein